MKKIIFSVVCAFLLFNNLQAQTQRLSVDSVCSDFNINVGIGIFSVSTTVYICCGGPFGNYQNPCSVVSKKMYQMMTARTADGTVKGIKVEELLEGRTFDKNAEYLEVLDSPGAKVGGKTLSVKKKKYPIDKEGFVYLEIETL